MHYQHLLIPVDLNVGERAVEAATQLAAQHAAVTLIHVIESINGEDEDTEADEEIGQFYADVRESVLRRMESLTQPLRQAGVDVRPPEIVVGNRARIIVQYSAEESVDLIVMESERVDLSQPERALRSVSHYVSQLCQCPVMLLK